MGGSFSLSCVSVLGVAFVVSLGLTPLMGRLAWAVGALDKPEGRKVHKEPVPRWGGLAILAAFLASLAFAGGLKGKAIPVALSGALMALVGAVDDKVGLRAGAKLLAQLAAAFLLVALGVRVEFVRNPFGEGLIYLGLWGVLFTVLWCVAITNTINLIDGLDGLAAGISALVAGTMLALSALHGRAESALMSAAVLGACLGFLPHNFHPAKIFMGDSGSQFLGMTLASVAIVGALKSATVIALVAPAVALGVPILDTTLAVLRRALTGRPIMMPDRGHIHHRLLDMGLSHRGAVLLLYAISGVLCLLAFLIGRPG